MYWLQCRAIEKRMACKRLQRLLIGCGLWFAVVPLVGAANLYRYNNDRGVTVVDWRIPAEYAAKGYEVLSEQGVVIEVVPPALTSAQRADRDVLQRQLEAAEVERRRLQAWDESLLLRYSDTVDIEEARDRALRELQIRISILRSNMRALRQRVESLQSRVAAAERRNETPNQYDLDSIQALKAEIVSIERSIEDRAQQVASVTENYQADIDRFKQLQDVVELRRRMSLEPRS
jgi:hypothetical protein